MTMSTMHVEQAITISAPRERVWTAFLSQTDQWWGSPYVLIEDAGSTIHLPSEVGQPVIERLGAHQASWGTASEIDPGTTYAWQGSMGMAQPSWGEVVHRFEDEPGGTRLTVSHAHMGEFSAGTATNYDHGWADLNHRLKIFVEQHRALGLSGENRPEDFPFTPSVARG